MTDTARPAATEEELRALMRDPRYWRTREPEFVKRVVDGFRGLCGASPAAPFALSPGDVVAAALAAITALRHAATVAYDNRQDKACGAFNLAAADVEAEIVRLRREAQPSTQETSL